MVVIRKLFSSSLASKIVLLCLYSALIVVLPTQTFKLPWMKKNSAEATTEQDVVKTDTVDLEALVGYNSSWCAYAYNHTFPDEYEMEYLKIKLCTNTTDADRIDALLRFQSLVEERGSIDELMTKIIGKLANYDHDKEEFLTADPFGVPAENGGCYQDVVEDFSKLCLDLELNPYANRFRNVFSHACQANWIMPKSQIESVFKEVCANGKSSSSLKGKNTEKAGSLDLRMYGDEPSDPVQGVNSSSYYNAFIAMTSDDYVFETLKEQSRSGYGSPDPQVAEARAAFKLVLKKRQFVNQLMAQLLTVLSDYDTKKKAFLTNDDYTIHDGIMKCYMEVLSDFTKHCLDPQVNPYAKRFRKVFAHICEADWLYQKKVHDVFEKTCQTTDMKNTAIISGTF